MQSWACRRCLQSRGLALGLHLRDAAHRPKERRDLRVRRVDHRGAHAARHAGQRHRAHSLRGGHLAKSAAVESPPSQRAETGRQTLKVLSH